MIKQILITPDLLLPRSDNDISTFHIQEAFNSNTKPDTPLNTISGIFIALKYFEYTDHKNYVMSDVLTSCRMSLLNHLQYKFI